MRGLLPRNPAAAADNAADVDRRLCWCAWRRCLRVRARDRPDPHPGAATDARRGWPPAGATLVDPVAGAIDVPLNLAAVVVRFPAP
jgi:hypothetical protein